jgi:uracil-DNA glycosylase family 4
MGVSPMPKTAEKPANGEMPMARLERDIHACCRCPRLVQYRAEIGAAKRRAYLHCDYWAKPVAGFGDPNATIWILGLAPGAHGANRTGRVFTGDRSGDFLFAALHRAGLSNQTSSVSMDDGLKLNDIFISATARCAPPGNKPLPREVANCQPFLDREWDLLKNKRIILALGAIAWTAAIAMAIRNGCELFAPRQDFSHGGELRLSPNLMLIGSYHVSQQNTFTGRLTAEMFDRVLERCAAHS